MKKPSDAAMQAARELVAKVYEMDEELPLHAIASRFDEFAAQAVAERDEAIFLLGECDRELERIGVSALLRDQIKLFMMGAT